MAIFMESPVENLEAAAMEETVRLLPKPFGVDALIDVISLTLGNVRPVPPAASK